MNEEPLLESRQYGLYRRVPVEAAGNCYLFMNGRVVVGPEYMVALTSFTSYFICSYILFYKVIDFVPSVVWWLTAVVFTLSLVFMLLTATSDPGAIVPRSRLSQEAHDARVVEVNGVRIKQKWCTSCNFYRPLRSSHCKVTNMHIARFDHMCSFLGTAIGVQNYRWFLGTIYFITLYSLLSIYLSSHYLKLQLLEQPIAATLTLNIDVILVLLVSIVSFLAFGLLVFYHTYITSHNLTMNEQVKKYYTNKNPFDRGSAWANFRSILSVHDDVIPDKIYPNLQSLHP